ncbi:Mitochondrial presequence protease [Coemansia sp. RSA 988]|nr:Mitochondrial presequence protease [Coemansia sp. RSA 988]
MHRGAIQGGRMLHASRSMAFPTFSRMPQRPVLAKARLFTNGNVTRAPRATTASGELEVGQEHHGFVVSDAQTVGELKLRAIRLRHQRTGAEWLHIAREDSNNAFSIGFTTSPSDSTGVAHILEHTTLCGSARYPVRDPFFKMLSRSMSTYMNAWTAHDYTQYPFATQNTKDYENLQGVYLDAVFRPLLRESDFRQEGWRLERGDAGDSTSSWGIKGVVYNEMKGAFSDAGSLFATRAEQQLFPDTTYAHVSGGDPQFIPDLTHEQLVEFHRTRYHPSNARVYSYGDMPLGPQLARVDEAISRFERMQAVAVPMEVKPFGSRKVTEFGPVESVGSPDKQTKFSVSYLTNDLRDVQETFGISVFSSLLLNGTSAPMHQALIDSHMGSGYSANTGYAPFTRQTSLAVGLQGIADKDIELAEKRIAETFARVGEDGFERRRVDAALAGVELAYKHRAADFGLSLMRSVSTGWFHGVDPISYLRVSDAVAQLRSAIDDGKFFQGIVNQYFAQSPHQLRYVMLPDPAYGQRLDTRENELIQTKVAGLSRRELEEIDAKNSALAAEQAKKEDVGALPTLTLGDVAERGQRHAVDMGVAGESVPVQWRTTATNGISYLRVINDVREKHPELWPYMPLFCEALTYLGTQKRDMAQIETDIGLHTGGISFSPFVTTDLGNLGHIEAGISFGSHCLDQHIGSMYELVLELVRETNFGNTGRLQALVNVMSTNMFNEVADSGHAFARRLAGSTLTPELQASESLRGISQVRFLSGLARLKDLQPVSERLRQVQEVVFNRLTMRTAVTTNQGSIDTNQQALDGMISNYPQPSHSNGATKASATSSSKFTAEAARVFCPLPFATNYAAQAVRTVPYTHADSVRLQILAKILTPNYLHREIRERNGAYGGGAVYSAAQGMFSFFSYRDPQPLETIATFNKAVDWILDHTISDRELDEAKLSVFGDLDTPLSVADEGMAYFTAGISDDMRQERREQFFEVTKSDLKDVANKYLASDEARKQTSVAVIGEEGLDMAGDWKREKLQ